MTKPSTADHYKAKLSELNERRRKFWNDFRELRNSFFLDFKAYQTDPEWQEIDLLIADMWDNGLVEDMRRALNLPPNRHFLPETRENRQILQGGGLYSSMDRACSRCGLPILGHSSCSRCGLAADDGLCPNCGKPVPDHSPCPDCGKPIPDRPLCRVCGLPIIGRSNKKYCSQSCRDKAKSRRWRHENPDEKQLANLKYLKDIFPEES